MSRQPFSLSLSLSIFLCYSSLVSLWTKKADSWWLFVELKKRKNNIRRWLKKQQIPNTRKNELEMSYMVSARLMWLIWQERKK